MIPFEKRLYGMWKLVHETVSLVNQKRESVQLLCKILFPQKGVGKSSQTANKNIHDPPNTFIVEELILYRLRSSHALERTFVHVPNWGNRVCSHLKSDPAQVSFVFIRTLFP